MTDAQLLQNSLHRSFTDAIAVRPVPFGFAINSPFYDDSGDSLAFYARDTEGGLVLEDDGSFLPHLIASGIDIDTGQRRQLLDAILSESGAYWDAQTYEIRTAPVSQSAAGAASVRFLSGLLRLRSLEKLTKETVRSTFKEDAIGSIEAELKDAFEIQLKASVSPDLEEFPADVVLTPKDRGRKLGIYLVSSSTQLLEADMLHREIERHGRQSAFGAVALIEDAGKIGVIGEKRFQRAANGGLPTRFYRGTERESVASLRRLAS